MSQSSATRWLTVGMGLSNAGTSELIWADGRRCAQEREAVGCEACVPLPGTGFQQR